MLSFKTVLLALASAKWASNIHALSVHAYCAQFMKGDSKVILRPSPVFLPNNHSIVCVSLEFEGFYPRFLPLSMSACILSVQLHSCIERKKKPLEV